MRGPQRDRADQASPFAPSFAQAFAPPRVLVITPTYDERDNIEAFADALFAARPDVELLVVDDASPDGTGDVADAMAARDPRVHVLHRAEKRGLGTAYVDGFGYGLARGFDVLVEMDADLSHDARSLDDILQAIGRGADVVIGSRAVRGGRVEGWGFGRHLLSRGGSLYARTILGLGTRDLTTGFKAYTRTALLAIEPARIRSNGYAFQIETTFLAARRGLRVVEVPIVFVDRRVGRSKMSKRIFGEAITAVWRMRLDAMLGRV